MKSKTKAQVEVQFNWMFVLVVGVILLIFFVTVVNRQKEAAEVTLSADVLVNLENIINGVVVSEDKTFLVTMPNVPIVYECTEGCACSIKVRAKGAKDIVIKNNPVFAPDNLKGTKALMWSQSFNIPFRATNFFYMTSPQAIYLIENTDLGQSIYDSLPPLKIIEEKTEQPAFTKELFNNLNNIENKNNYKVKFIFTDTTPNNVPASLTTMPDSDVSAIKINEADNTITFYQKKGSKFESKGNSRYIESASLYGAVFSESKEMYECMMDKAFESASFVAAVYAKRAEIIIKKYTDAGNNECAVYYDPLYINEILKITSSKFKGNNKLNNLPSQIQGLRAQNEGALLFSCAAIY